MNPDHNSRLRQQEREDFSTPAAHKQFAQGTNAPMEFASPEELFRHDSQANPVPPGVAHRLNRSLAAEPRPAKSWLRRLFG
jgi:hypothetical protein